ncbi:PfkB family carbohydrate kinase [Petroclostridium sp. X23]|uniref:PfkB family carbohydrate kinase n=1 Tax=Petroclostridium sp. X23 TaxID=3045146 RepID=UPI0024AD0097|nr:PfkB family carbohydrate kinase [Petroclostridium sp. X23]WHH60836.1 PfkB family carbohydrate kinase [Petroclostridium sp. X23]
MLKVLGIGDNVCDIYLHSGEMYPGGQALNFAVYAKNLGVSSAYMGVFGQDEIAWHIIHTLDALKVEHVRCRQYEGENGYAVVNLVDGDRVFMGSNRGGITKEKPIVLEEADKEYIQTFDLVHTSNNSYFDDQLKSLHALEIPISYDFSNKWEDWERTARICPYITFGFLSCGSMSQEETQQICKKVHQLGCKIVIATMGSKGAWLYNGELMLFQPPKTVEAIDTLGAGDSFATGFLVCLSKAQKENPDKLDTDSSYREQIFKQALEEGAVLAAKNCLVRGAFGYAAKIPESVLQKLI